MMQITVLVSDVNYDSITAEEAKKRLGSPFGIVGGATKIIPHDVKRKLAIKFIKSKEKKILGYLSKSLDKKGFPITFQSLEVSDASESGMEMELRINLGDIDYAAIATTVYENKERWLTRSEKASEILSYVDVAGGQLTVDYISSLPQETKDGLVGFFLTKYSNKITSALNKYIRKKKWDLTLTEVRIKTF